jgi:hypothetical protein
VKRKGLFLFLQKSERRAARRPRELHFVDFCQKIFKRIVISLKLSWNVTVSSKTFALIVKFHQHPSRKVKINFCKTLAKNENENFRFNTNVSAHS